VRELIATLLRIEGHEIFTAENGLEALAACERRIPDLIVLDLAMPEMDGWRFLEELHRTGMRRATRVLIVSAYVDDEPESSRIRHMLDKPFLPETLIRMVEDALTYQPDELFELKQRSHSLRRIVSLEEIEDLHPHPHEAG
jgi:CheY-like chemotaxis protein